jgi:hypothetical protein
MDYIATETCMVATISFATKSSLKQKMMPQQHIVQDY